ncbi:short chain dehydrogenase family protein [Streptococcus intermedius BA1]|nr:short chain dehydrogenase family protein [Streptococcus intermedius BA1]
MIALVTGASAGFGQDICRRLVAEGHQVIGAARRSEKLAQLQQELGFANFYPLQMDVSDTKNIDQALESLPEAWRTIDILINNAGVALGLDKAYEADMQDWLTMI